MRCITVLLLIVFLSAGSAWSEIGESVGDFMNSAYMKENRIHTAVSQIIDKDTASALDLSYYEGKKWYPFFFFKEVPVVPAYQITYEIMIVAEADGSNIALEEFLLDYPFNERFRLDAEESIISFVDEATGGAVLLDTESLNAIMRDVGKTDKASRQIEGFTITICQFLSGKKHTIWGGNGYVLDVRVSK